MSDTKKDNVLVVLQLSGGNDALNTIVPYSDPLYLENRPVVRVDPEQVLPINDTIGFNPNMAPIKELWDAGERGDHSGRWLSEPGPLPLSLHGYLAHL